MSQEQTINDIAIKVGRFEVMQETSAKAIGDMANSVNKLVEKLDQSDDVAKEARDRAKSAHHRIDDIKKRMDDVHTSNRWAIGTSLTVLALFLTAVGILIKFLEN